MSSLNPSALPFIPSQKQRSEHQRQTDEASDFQSEAHSGNEQENEFNCIGHITENISYLAISKDEGADEAVAVMENDLNFMSIFFPNSSREALADIYCANHGDLIASVQRMSELEEFGANKDFELATQKDETQKQGQDQVWDVTEKSYGENSNQ